MIVDLRSDTVTRPTPAMYAAIAAAELGDDVLGDEPTVDRLERLAAETVGMEAAVFVPSGTMGNQIALAAATNPGDSVLFEEGAHMLWYEVGGPAVLSGVQTMSVPSVAGVMEPAVLESRIFKPSLHTPGTTVICLENTNNRAGGTVIPLDHHVAYRDITNRHGLHLHLDGARLFNASVRLGVAAREITRHVDSVSICLSKGLCAPVGSVLCGSAAHIAKARIWRKRLGGGMRQAGILAACGIVALEQMVDRLPEDHQRATELAEALDGLPGLTVVQPETNILMLDTERPAEEWVAALEAAGVRCFAFGEYRLRLVFHHDVGQDHLLRAIAVFRQLAISFA